MPDPIGFLSVRLHEVHGYFGGYLLINHHTRPLEFHCTLPVKPSRAQQVLYGPTIHDFVCGEQIAKALVTKAKLKPELIVTDSRPVLALQNVTSFQTVLFDTKSSERSPETETSHRDAGNASDEGAAMRIPPSSLATHSLSFRNNRLNALEDAKAIQALVDRVLEPVGANFEFGEPFQRILEALLEAHPIAKAA